MKKFLLCISLTATAGFAAIAQTGNVGIGTTTPGSKLTVNGSFAAAFTPVTANTYTIGENDFSIRWNGTADGIITLLASSTTPDRTGRLYFIKNVSTASVLTIDGSGSELIDSDTSIVIQPGESVLLTKTDNNTATGTTYMVMQLSQTQQPYIYNISGAGGQTIAQGATATLDFTTVDYSTNGGVDFNATTNAWTCPQSGWYSITATAQATSNSANSHVNLIVRKNGPTAVGSGFFFVPVTVSNSGAAIKTVNLVQGDQITVTATPCSGCGSPSIVVSNRQIEISRM